MLAYSLPPGYQRQKPVRRPKLGPWQATIDAILGEDQSRPAKQRHTAKRIFERLREEHSYSGGYTIVKDYVRQTRIGAREMFVPLSHAPGEAQADFGEALVMIGGEEHTAHYLAFDLPHSDDCFVVAFPAKTTEAFLEGHVRSFAYFGGVPRYILYDNTKLAVARILGDGERQKTRAFSELQSHYLFAEKFGHPAKGNDKGKVEGLIGYARRNFMVPVPRASSWEELNRYLEAACMNRRERRLRGHRETIAERFERDRATLLPLPAAPLEACEKITTRVTSVSLVRYRCNDYSVPTGWRLDADRSVGEIFRLVQFTPPGSGSSVQFGVNLTAAAPGSAHGMLLAVSDIEAAREQLVTQGVDASAVFHCEAGTACRFSQHWRSCQRFTTRAS
jgi:transposase